MIDILGWIGIGSGIGSGSGSGLVMGGNNRSESIIITAHLDIYAYSNVQVLDKGDEGIVVLVSFLVLFY
ncbi:MAG: hypothetical protein SVY53_03460 [Chloroflexota bacterium]|nr:hypothetical protein [Chloroflexota bacterium]